MELAFRYTGHFDLKYLTPFFKIFVHKIENLKYRAIYEYEFHHGTNAAETGQKKTYDERCIRTIIAELYQCG